MNQIINQGTQTGKQGNQNTMKTEHTRYVADTSFNEQILKVIKEENPAN